MTDLRESHDCNAKKAAKEPKVGDVVIVFDEGAKRNSWKTAVIEDLIPGKDNQVRGAHLRVITKRKAVRLSRPIQKLYPIEDCESSTNLPRSQEKQVERERTLRRRVIPRRTAALDAVWKTREMINQSDDYSLRADDKNTLISTVCEAAQRNLFWTTNGSAFRISLQPDWRSRQTKQRPFLTGQSWRVLKSGYTAGSLEKGFRRCFADGVNQGLISSARRLDD